MLYDAFICHASEDKESFARPLAEALRQHHLEVWYDEFALRVGDSIRRAIDIGLKQSTYGIVVLSQAFFAKNWPQYELDGLLDREISGGQPVVLPVWHGVTHDDVASYSPALAVRHAVSSDEGLPSVVADLLRVVRPEGSPLLIARDFLIAHGLEPPVVTHEYWLTVAEVSNRLPPAGAWIPEESTWGRWAFSLPAASTDPDDWGERLGWAALQMAWTTRAEEVPLR